MNFRNRGSVWLGCLKRSRRSLALVAWLTASLSASPNGLAAGPQQATPPPLPPDTVNQVGLRWDLNTIGTSANSGATKPFRFSLCEGRYLAPDEVSRPCDPSRVRGVTGGHDAPFVFSAGHNRFLPKGLSIDGNGILKGDDPGLLTNLDVPMCVRQIDVEGCKTIHLRNDKPTLIEPDPIALAIDNGSGPPKKGMGMRPLALALGLGAAAVAVGAASQLATVEEGSTSDGCPSYNEICGGGAGFACAGIPSSCGCAGARNMGTVSQSVANASRGQCTVGSLNCQCN